MSPWEFHPALVHFPIAFLLGGVVLDLFGRRSERIVVTASHLLIAGLGTAVIAAAAGVVAYYTVPGLHTEAAHQSIYWHIGANVTAVVLFALVCFARWRRPAVVSPMIRVLGWVAAAAMIYGSYIGGELVYKGGMGVDPAILKPDLRAGTAAIAPPRESGEGGAGRPSDAGDPAAPPTVMISRREIII